MTDLRILAIAALVLNLCAACAKSEPPASGTNTNWLKHCDTSVDCDGAGDCLCGVCTLSCKGNAECSPVGRGVSCTPASGASCEDGTTGSLCLPKPAQSNAGDAGLTLTRVGSEVQVTDRYRACGLDDDCVLVGTSCNGCCEQDAIRAHDRDAYAFNHELACSDYRGPICDCSLADIVPRCIDGLCATAEPDPVRDCYSPTQNVQRANFPAALGCECAPVGLEICTGSFSLACVKGADGSRWARVDSRPCPSETDCFEERRRADADACLADYVRCFELPAGGFCGSGCRAPLMCSGEDCQYSPFSLAECDDGIWEGVCGNVRYRSQSASLSGQWLAWYWNEATGELLATRSTSDSTNSPCGGDVVSGDLAVVATCEVARNTTTEICSP